MNLPFRNYFYQKENNLFVMSVNTEQNFLADCLKWRESGGILFFFKIRSCLIKKRL